MTFQGTPIPTGVVQSTYPNQMATALAGSLANATDVNLVDSIIVSGANGILAGRAAFGAAATDNARAGVNSRTVTDTATAVSAGNATAANFWGVAMRTLAGWSATTEAPLWPTNVVAPIARPGRSGCRVWVETNVHDTIAEGDSVYVVTVAGSYNEIGTFTNTSAPNGATAVLLPGATFRSAGALAAQMVEFMLPAASVSEASALSALDAVTPHAVITFTSEVSHARTITIQLKDVNNSNIAAVQSLRFTVQPTSATTYVASATSTDTFGAPSAGTLLETITAKAEYIVLTDSAGKYVFTITQNDAGSSRWLTAIVGGLVAVSAEMTFSAV